MTGKEYKKTTNVTQRGKSGGNQKENNAPAGLWGLLPFPMLGSKSGPFHSQSVSEQGMPLNLRFIICLGPTPWWCAFWEQEKGADPRAHPEDAEIQPAVPAWVRVPTSGAAGLMSAPEEGERGDGVSGQESWRHLPGAAKAGRQQTLPG